VSGAIPRIIPPGSTYADAFGLQWNVYRKTQLDSFTRVNLSERRARRCMGEECWALLHRDAETHVLEVGCGAGRFTEVLLTTRARVTSVDLSSAVDANQENFPQDERHRVIQANALALPFAPGQFDVVFCLGTIQHTPDPEQTIAKLYDQVKPGGWLVIDHYTYTLSRFTKTAPLVRMALKRLPPEDGLKWTKRLVDWFFPLHRAVKGHRLAQMLLSRISPVQVYFHHYPLSDDVQRQWALLDTHDTLTDWYKHLRTRGQIRRTLAQLGAADITCEYGGNGVEAHCRRPQPAVFGVPSM
jgi:SAM-dependent methyltransferase